MITFGAAKITIDRGDRLDNFRTRRSIPLREEVTDSKGQVVRSPEDTDPQGRKLWRAVNTEFKIWKTMLDQIPDDTVELRVSRTPHPEHPEDPEKDTIRIEYRPNGTFSSGNSSFDGITEGGLRWDQSAMMYGMLRKRFLESIKK